MDSERHPICDHETMQIELLRRRQTPLRIEDIEDMLDDSDSDDDSGDVHVPQDLVQDSYDDVDSGAVDVLQDRVQDSDDDDCWYP
jgi:hypothetical protein